MKKYKYTEAEQQMNMILNHQQKQLNALKVEHVDETRVSESEAILQSLGYALPGNTSEKLIVEKKNILIPSWDQLADEAQSDVGSNHVLTEIFSDADLKSNELYMRTLSDDFNALHHLDWIDYSICALAGILSGALDILLVGIPKATPDGLKAGTLSNYIREQFDKKFPQKEMEELANSKASKVSFDAQDNRHTNVHVEGLSAYYHRLLSLGHDPLLGFVVGVFDIMTGRMTTIDKNGRIVSQIMENYAGRRETNIFAALAKQFIHLKSDITTSMGLPAPLMSLFNLFQFGSIGEEEQTIAEIVQGMYYEGYDFIHYCSASIPVLLTEVIVRISYAVRRIRAGYTVKESIPFSLNREKHPKLATMLFISHTAAAAINAGKVYFTGNPMAINYPQWVSFAKHSFQQLKWFLVEKPMLRDKYIQGCLDESFKETILSVDETMDRFSDGYSFILS